MDFFTYFGAVLLGYGLGYIVFDKSPKTNKKKPAHVCICDTHCGSGDNGASAGMCKTHVDRVMKMKPPGIVRKRKK